MLAAMGRGVNRAAHIHFIVKASGILSRYVVDKDGVLDPNRMRPRIELRDEDELGIQAEMAMPAT